MGNVAWTVINRRQEIAEVSLKMLRRRKRRRLFPQGHDPLTPGLQDPALPWESFLEGFPWSQSMEGSGCNQSKVF